MQTAFPSNRHRLLILAILVLACAVRIWDIRARALWFDEASEYWIATAPFAQLVESARTGTGDPPLYSFLLHGWMQLGNTEVWLRALSIIASVSGVLAVMILAGMFSGWTAAWCAGLMIALLPADVRYAQEVGQYGLIPALVAWNLVCLVLMTRHASWRWILGWTATALAASYLYYGAALPVGACFAAVIVESIFRRDIRVRRATGTSLILYVAGVIPLFISYLPTQLARVVESGGVGAGAGAGFLHKTWNFLCELFAFQFSGWPHTRVPAVAVLIPVAFLLVRAAPRAPRLASWLAVSALGYGLVSLVGLFPMGYRWGMILTPLIICAIATGAASGGASWRRRANFAALAALLLVCAASLPNRTLHDRVYPDTSGAWPETEDMRVVADYWMAHRTREQPTYVYYGAAPAFAYYTRDFAKRTSLPSTWHFACWHDTSPPDFCRDHDIYYGRWGRRLDTEGQIANVFASMGGQPDALWLVFAHMVPGDDREMINGFVRRGYRIEAAVSAVNASACLLTRDR